MRARSLPTALALALLSAAGACGSAPAQGGEAQSIVVIHVNIDPSVPALHQVKVAAHLGDQGLDDTLLFPITPTADAIPSGATLALLLPTTRMGLLDLILTGYDASNQAVAAGNGQTTIAVGKQIDVNIQLTPCTTCN